MIIYCSDQFIGEMSNILILPFNYRLTNSLRLLSRYLAFQNPMWKLFVAERVETKRFQYPAWRMMLVRVKWIL